MLGQIEILLAFSAVMAAMSLLITVCNQAGSALLNLRGWSLRWGIAAALKNLFPQLKKRASPTSKIFADHIAHEVLVHPLISDSILPVARLAHWRLASAIRFEELARIISVMADPDKGKNLETATWTNEDAVAWLSRRLGPVNDWFGVVMDRVTQHFAFYMRLSTVVIATIMVFSLQVDSISLYNGLSADVKLRNGVLANIESLKAAREALDNASKTDPTKKAAADNSGAQLDQINAEAVGSVADSLRSPLAAARKNVTPLGQLITIALLSLGAPFWFNRLKDLTNLRSVVANKEEKEKERTAAAKVSPGPQQPQRQALASTAERNEGELS